CAGQPALDLLASRVVPAHCKRWRCVIVEDQWVRCVYHRLALEVGRAGEFERALRAAPKRSENDDLTELRRIRERTGRGARTVRRLPFLELVAVRLARADHDLVAATDEAAAEHAAHGAGSYNADSHRCILFSGAAKVSAPCARTLGAMSTSRRPQF